MVSRPTGRTTLASTDPMHAPGTYCLQKRFELADHVGSLAAAEFRLNRLLEHGRPQFVEPLHFTSGQRGVGHILARLTAKTTRWLREQANGVTKITTTDRLTSVADKPGDPSRVDINTVGIEPVIRRCDA